MSEIFTKIIKQELYEEIQVKYIEGQRIRICRNTKLKNDEQLYFIRLCNVQVKFEKAKEHLQRLRQQAVRIKVQRYVDSKVYNEGRDPQYLLITEFLPGKSLEMHHETKRPFEEKVCRTIMRSLVQTISQLHKRNIFHRNVALENIVFDKQYNPTLVGFGRAISTTGQVYSDPDISQNIKAQEMRTFHHPQPSEIFQLGVLLFQMAVGRNPFERTLAADRSYQLIIKEKWSSFQEYHEQEMKHLDPTLKHLLKLMLCHSPESRIKTADILKTQWFSNLKADYATQEYIKLYFQDKLSEENIDPININESGSLSTSSKDISSVYQSQRSSVRSSQSAFHSKKQDVSPYQVPKKKFRN